jgi:hypothetical protein
MSSSHRDDDDDPNFALVGGEGATKKSRNSLSLLLVFVVLLAHEALDVGQRFPIGFLTKAHYCDDGTTTTTTKNPTKKGLLFASLSYLVYSYLQGQDTHMKRPHPGVWRVAHGGFVMYMLFLVFLVFQDTRETARGTRRRHLYGVACGRYFCARRHTHTHGERQHRVSSSSSSSSALT